MASTSRYGYARLGRYGLTHGLLAWARCAVWCEQTGAQMIAPFWFKPRIGPYLRRERDKRNYFLLFHAGGQISGLRRLALLAKLPKFPVGQGAPAANGGSGIMLFENALADNEKKSFAQVVDHGPFLRSRLLAITRRHHIPPAPAEPFIAIHVRLGDFAEPSGKNAVGNNVRLPIDWYADRLLSLRAALAVAVPAVVFSDGSEEELAPLLRLAAVTRAPKAESVTDLLALGAGACVIGSASGFSLWGAFLGSAPRLSHVGKQIVPIYIGEGAEGDIESAFGADIPPTFVTRLMARMG